MELTFSDERWRALRDDPQAKSRFPAEIVKAYRKTLNIIAQARDERDLHAMNSLWFKRLQGNRQHQHSLRLNDKWRLIVEVDERQSPHTIHVISIEDYH